MVDLEGSQLSHSVKTQWTKPLSFQVSPETTVKYTSQAEGSFSLVCWAFWGNSLDGHQMVSIFMVDSKGLRMDSELLWTSV